VEKTMGLLYMFPRRLFWRKWQPKLSKLSQHFFFDLGRELSDTPRTPAFCHHSLFFYPTIVLIPISASIFLNTFSKFIHHRITFAVCILTLNYQEHVNSGNHNCWAVIT
jgi:hypothetical protein